MIRKITILGLFLFVFGTVLRAQNYTPITLTPSSYRADIVAEKLPFDSFSTSMGMDGNLPPAPGAPIPVPYYGQHVLYTTSFATAAGVTGGLPDNGTVTKTVAGITRTFQLRRYDSANAFYAPNDNSVDTITFATPAYYSKLSFLALSTEGSATLSITFLFADGTKAGGGTVTITDWFQVGGANTQIVGFGRIQRWPYNSPITVDGTTSSGSPAEMYYNDYALSCANMTKPVKALLIQNTTGGSGAPRYPYPFIMGVSGISYTPPVITLSSSPDGCSNAAGTHSGTATVTVTGGSAAPFTYKWSTIPVQTNPIATLLAPGRDSVTLTDANGCKTVTAAVIIDSGIKPKPVIASVDTCVGFNVTLSVIKPGTDTTYKWYTGSTSGTLVNTGNTYAVPGTTATYYVDGTITNSTTCVSTARTPVTVTFESILAQPVVTVAASSPTSVTFQWAAVPGATGYIVSVNGGAYQTPSSSATGTTHTVTGTTGANVSISVIAYGKLACQVSTPGTASFVIPSNGVFVPKAFTPNGDGINDVLFVYGNFIQQLDMKIFNQWGQSIFETANKGNGWDGTYKGKMQPSGVYMYALKATLQDGTVVNTKGAINLIR